MNGFSIILLIFLLNPWQGIILIIIESMIYFGLLKLKISNNNINKRIPDISIGNYLLTLILVSVMYKFRLPVRISFKKSWIKLFILKIVINGLICFSSFEFLEGDTF